MDENLDNIRVIFLSIDGVLNGYSFFNYILFRICKVLHLEFWFYKRFHIFKVQNKKVKILKEIIKKTNAVVVLCSENRFSWYNIPFEGQRKMCKDFSLALFRNKINVISVTPKLSSDYKREDEVNTWIMNNKSVIKSFIILDDKREFYPHLKINHCVNLCTKSYPIGLRKRHIKECLTLFEKQEQNRMD